MKNALKQGKLGEALRFLVTGGACFLVEFLALVFLRDGLGMDTLAAVPIAFSLSVLLNYVLCVSWVFRGASGQGAFAKAGFAVTSVTGLALNELLMLLFRVLWGEDAVAVVLLGFTVTMYMVNKVLATALVMIWNYYTKRAVLNWGKKKRQGN